MTDKIVYLTTRKTTVRRHKEEKPKGIIDVYEGGNGLTGIDACVPAIVATRMLLVATKAGIKIR